MSGSAEAIPAQCLQVGGQLHLLLLILLLMLGAWLHFNLPSCTQTSQTEDVLGGIGYL